LDSEVNCEVKAFVRALTIGLYEGERSQIHDLCSDEQLKLLEHMLVWSDAGSYIGDMVNLQEIVQSLFKFNVSHPRGLLGQISTICAGAAQYNCLLSSQRWPILETTIYRDVFA
jgi:hypothetical protein